MKVLGGIAEETHAPPDHCQPEDGEPFFTPDLPRLPENRLN